MKATAYFSAEDKKALHSAIHAAERITSGEIRLYIEDECNEDVMDRAAYIFSLLNMHKTAMRNGVLIYLAFEKHKFAIIGDVGINSKVGGNFWQSVKDQMQALFEKGRITDGLVTGISQAAIALKENFPFKGGDTNELPDEIIIK